MSFLRAEWISVLVINLLALSGCDSNDDADKLSRTELKVTATAYTSHKAQTDKTPFLAAWNNPLKPGIKSIAVSRDLLKKGLRNGSKVKIEGLPGEYTVLDKMHKRWKNKIDIYMGLDYDKAKTWGKKTVVISWNSPTTEAP